MAQSASRKKAADIVPPLAVGVLILIAWETFCRALAIPPYLFPMPSVIAKTLVADAPALLHALWVTLRVTLIALALAVTIGATIAFLFVQSPIIERSFFPYAIILQVTPIVAIAPLIIILVKNTQGALIICATIIAIFPIISNTTVGLRSVDQGHRDLFAINQAFSTAHPERAAVFFRRFAHFERACADWGGGGRVRRRHRGPQCRARL